MQAIRIHEVGGPEVLRYETIDDPTPGPGQVLVKVAAIGLNYIDTYHRTGLYPQPLPFTPGLEIAGTIAALGSEVQGWQVGDRVATTSAIGGYAELALVPSDKLVAVPANVALTVAAALMLQGMTAHYLAYSTFPLSADKTCLIHAAAGGVGLLLTQIAKRCGARVIGTVSTEEKAALARAAGADEVIIYTEEDFSAKTRSLTDGSGVDVAYDSVGKSTWEGSLNALRPRGMLILFGNASGPVPPLDPLLLSSKGSIFVTRPTLAHHIATIAELRERAEALLSWVERGELSVHIDREFSLARAAEAHQALESRATSGKVLIIP